MTPRQEQVLAQMAATGASAAELTAMAQLFGGIAARAATVPTVKAPLARTAAVVVVSPNAAKGQTFAPYKVLQTSNGANGAMHHGKNLSAADVVAVIGWLKSPEGAAFIKSATFA